MKPTTTKPLPKLGIHQLAWIFDTAREKFSEDVRNIQLDICHRVLRLDARESG